MRSIRYFVLIVIVQKEMFDNVTIRPSVFFILRAAFIVLLLSNCATKQPLGTSTDALQELAVRAALYRAATTFQDVVVWTVDANDALTTHWVRGNRISATIVASRSGLLLPANSGLWELREVDVEVPLCDCELWTKRKRMGECPRAGESADVNLPIIVDLITGSEVELLPTTEVQEQASLIDSQYTSVVSITGSVGPYLFISKSVERTRCGDGNVLSDTTFLVFDINSKQRVTVFEPDERQKVLENEQMAAYEQFRSDPNIRIKSPEDLEFTRIDVGLLPGVGLALGYQFTARAFYADSQGNRSAYVRSTTITAEEIPRALVPYAEFPPGLYHFVMTSEEIRVGGWVSITLDDIGRLQNTNAFNLKNNTN